MLRWRLLIGIPAVAALVLLCWLDAIAPVPGILLVPIFLVCVYFLCKETLQLLNAGGIYPRRTTIYFGVFGTIILSWFSCYNSLPLMAELDRTIATAIQNDAGNRNENDDAPKTASVKTTDGEIAASETEAEELGRLAKALEAARNALKTAESAAENALKRSQKNDAAAQNVAASENETEINGTVSPEVAPEPTLFAFSNENEWKTAAFACVHILLAIAAGVLIAFVGEMLRFKLPGGHMINLSGAIFAIAYVGLLGSFMVMLRIAYGVAAVVSMIVVVKFCDIGAYTVGRLVGRHKMAPNLSPGKTIEGGFGGVAFAILGAWLSTAVIFPLATGEPSQTTWIGVVVYGVTVGLAGALGDLAESLIKRDVMRKDSGTNVPGFGGFLDIFDSLLLAAPVAFGLWAFHVVR